MSKGELIEALRAPVEEEDESDKDESDDSYLDEYCPTYVLW